MGGGGGGGGGGGRGGGVEGGGGMVCIEHALISSHVSSQMSVYNMHN